MTAETPADPQKGAPDEEAHVEVATGSAPEAAAEPSAKAEARVAKKPARKRKAAKRREDAGEQAAAEQTGERAAPSGAEAEAQPTKRRSRAKKPALKKAAEKATEAPAGKPAGKPVAAVAERKAEPAAAARGAAGKQARRRRVVRARARYVRTSARKARMVCGHLRGKSVEEARAILAFTPREVARDWSKLLESAVANAESNHELLEDELIIREAYADEGPTIKRFRPRAMGRATPIRKRTSHLTIGLTARPETTTSKRHG